MPPVIFSAISDHWQPLGFAFGIMLVAIFLGLWQWYDRRARETNLNELDRDFFRRQDFRRWVGIAVMVILAAAIAIEPFVTVRIREPAAKGTWLAGFQSGLIGLIVALIALAIADSMATMRYARRHRGELDRQRRELERQRNELLERQRHERANEKGKIMLEVIRRAGSSDSFRPIPDKKNDAPEG